MRRFIGALMGTVAIAAITSEAPAQVAVPLTVGGGWSTFYFTSSGSPFQTVETFTSLPSVLSFNFTLTSKAYFAVTDGYFSGDQFAVSINGGPLLETSTPSFSFDYVGNDWDAGFSDPNYSSGYVLLDPGTYVVYGEALYSPYLSGAGAAELLSSIPVGEGAGGPFVFVPVPEPSTWAMMIAGAFGAGAMLRRRRQAAPVA